MQPATDLETRIKSMNCPLCEKNEVIPFDRERYDYHAHALVCPALSEIDIEMRGPLLKGKIVGENYSDLLGGSMNLRELESILNQDGFQLDLKGYIKAQETADHTRDWMFVISIKHSEIDPSGTKHSHYPKAESRDLNKAFKMLCHLLFCGEAICMHTLINGDVQRIWRWDREARRLSYKGEKYIPKYGNSQKTL